MKRVASAAFLVSLTQSCSCDDGVRPIAGQPCMEDDCQGEVPRCDPRLDPTCVAPEEPEDAGQLIDGGAICVTPEGTGPCPLSDCPAGEHLDEATDACVDNVRVVPCPTPPRNGVANTATEVTQVWDGDAQAWPPLPVLTYDPEPAADACVYACGEGYTRNAFGACVGPPERIDCAHAAGEQGDDLYWVDADGLLVELVEDCTYSRSTLNCAGTRMSDDGTLDGIAKAVAAGLNPEAFLGCCGPNASTIDVYGCLPYQELDEPCYDVLRYFGKCVEGLHCSNAGPGSAYPQTCQE